MKTRKAFTVLELMLCIIFVGIFVVLDKNQYYPEKIDKAEILPWIDPNLFTDPYGVALWKEGSNYTYEAKECEDEKCKSYELRSIMEKEEDFVKTSRN